MKALFFKGLNSFHVLKQIFLELPAFFYGPFYHAFLIPNKP